MNFEIHKNNIFFDFLAILTSNARGLHICSRNTTRNFNHGDTIFLSLANNKTNSAKHLLQKKKVQNNKKNFNVQRTFRLHLVDHMLLVFQRKGYFLFGTSLLFLKNIVCWP